MFIYGLAVQIGPRSGRVTGRRLRTPVPHSVTKRGINTEQHI